MPTFDDMYRKTMAILSESVSDVLGPTDAEQEDEKELPPTFLQPGKSGEDAGSIVE